MIIAENKGKTRELIPAGNYVCRAYSLIEIGTVTEFYEGEPKTQHKIMLTWELPTELRIFNPEKGKQPMVISQEFTNSLNEKANLRKILESWRGKGFTEEELKGFDLEKIVGVPGLVNIIHKRKQNGDMKQVIASITPLPRGMKCANQINPTLILGYDNFDDAAFNLLPDFLKTKMRSSEEFKSLMNPQTKEMSDDEHFIKNGGPEEEHYDDSQLPF